MKEGTEESSSTQQNTVRMPEESRVITQLTVLNTYRRVILLIKDIKDLCRSPQSVPKVAMGPHECAVVSNPRRQDSKEAGMLWNVRGNKKQGQVRREPI